VVPLVPLNSHQISPVTSVNSASAAASSLSPSSPSFIHLIGSSWPYEMSSDMTFASLVPSAAFAMSTLMSASASASVLATPKPTVRASGSTTRCGAEMPPARGLLPVQHDLTTPRARARAARLRANEAAERREDLAALVTTPVSHPSPFDGCNTTRTSLTVPLFYSCYWGTMLYD
jgi:hypothetical protein